MIRVKRVPSHAHVHILSVSAPPGSRRSSGLPSDLTCANGADPFPQIACATDDGPFSMLFGIVV